MSCRTRVVAWVLLVSPPALAQLSVDVDAGTSGADAGGCVTTDANADGAEGCPTAAVAAPSDEDTEASRADAMPRRAGGLGDGEPQSNVTLDTALDRWRHRAAAEQTSSTWTVDLEAVLGQRSLYRSFEVYCCPLGATVSGSSFLATIQYRPAVSILSSWHLFSIGAVVPFGIGDVDRGHQGFLYGHLGALALFGTWAKRVNRTQLSVGLMVALPTWLGPPSDEPVEFAEGTRGYEDRELFSRGFALAPRAAVLHDFGRVEVSALVKVALRLSCSGENPCEDAAFVVDVVGAGQVMVKAVNHPRAVVSGGARAIGMLSMWGVSVAVEPRVEARFGALALRAGFIIPLFTTFTAGYYKVGAGSWNTGRFPEAWGVRVGVGFGFQ